MTDFSTFDEGELLALADWHFQKDDFERSLEKLKVLLARSTPPLQTYAVLGRLYATIGLLEKAKTIFEYYLENQSAEHMRVNETFQLGLVERDLGNVEQALVIWGDLLVKHPNHSPTLYHKAVALVEAGDNQKAVDLLNRLLETADDNDGHIQMADQLLSRLALQ